MSYGGVTYNFEELLATIGLYTPSTPVGINTNGMGPEIGNEYDRAIDKMAKFMDQFCFSIGSHPAPDGPWTLASSSNAMNHLRNLGFDVLYYQYVADSVARDISANKLVYMDGRKVNDASKGHAFVVDGLGCWEYIYEDGSKYSSEPYLHVVWGLQGKECDGYYNSDVISFGNNLNYWPSTCYAINKIISL